MNVSVLIATFGDYAWTYTAMQRAFPSTENQGAEVHVSYQADGTICSVRNQTAKDATGDWLCFLDADDELAPGFVGAMRRALERETGAGGTANLLLTPAVQTSRNGRRRAPFFYPEKDLAEANWLVIGTLISRDLFWQVGGFNELTPHGLEDWELWTKAARAGARVVKVPDAVYVAHQDRRTRSHSRYFRSDRDGYMREYRRIRDEVWA